MANLAQAELLVAGREKKISKPVKECCIERIHFHHLPDNNKAPPALQQDRLPLIFKTTDANALRTGGVVHVGVAAVEVQVATVDAIHRTAPVDPAAACGVQRTIAVTA
ncbi:hypothetical protein JCM39068_44010 [Desulfocastanea catecholica]